MPLYNVRTGLYENNEGKFETYSDAKKIKWKCEKCSQTFQSFIPIKVVIVSMSVMAQKHLFPVSYLRVREPQKIQKQKTGWMRTIVEQLFIIQFHVLST